MSTTPPVPPDLQQPDPTQGAAPPVPTGNPQPAPPPKESFGQGVRRGAGGEPYFVDAQGNMTSARTTQDSPKGKFGSILAGAVLGALSGAGASRPGGIPSHELGGGFGAGAKAATDRVQQVDQRNRGRAQQDFENRNTAKESQNKDLSYKASLHLSDLSAIKMAHEIDEAKRNDPVLYQQHVNAATETQLSLESSAKNMGLINERTFGDYSSVPKADIDKFNRGQVKLLALPDGTVKVWDRTFDARATPNTSDFQVKSLVGLDPKTGKPEWKVEGNVKTGAGTVAQQEAEIDKQRVQLQDAATKNAANEKSKAESFKATAEGEKALKEGEALGGDVLKNNAQQLVDGNMDPSQLSKKASSYNATLKAANDYSLQKYGKPFDVAQAASDYKFATNTGTQNTLKYLNSLVGADNKGGNLGNLVQLSSKINRTELPPLNDIEAWAKINTGDPQMAAYDAAITEVADQVAKILQGGGTGNGTSDAKLKQAQELFSKKFTKDQVTAIAGTLRDLLGNRKTEMIGSNRYLQKQYATPQAQPNKVPGIPDGGTPVMQNGKAIGYRLADTPAGQMIPLSAPPQG